MRGVMRVVVISKNASKELDENKYVVWKVLYETVNRNKEIQKKNISYPVTILLKTFFVDSQLKIERVGNLRTKA